MPKSSPINIKVQNKNKEYLSINIKDVNKGGQAFVQVLDRLWIIVVPNIYVHKWYYSFNGRSLCF